MTFQTGALVRARGREWVVLPESNDELVLLRPLGGTNAEVAGVLTVLEQVEPATFPPPDPEQSGDYHSARLLRDALRLGFRSSAGPFRSFASLAVDPRPYQLVPLLMALRMDPVRLLIADDVGIGKTVEAALIAQELIASGAATRLAVLCPPHLAEQWHAELRDKFNLEATLVLASTAGRLERSCSIGESLFDLHPHVIVSTDFIKSERRRNEFLRACPELVIVDEAHTCAADAPGRAAHQRHELVRGLAQDQSRHLILVTATPHSGKPEAFRSLVSLLDPALEGLPDDLSGPIHEGDRRRLAQRMVQRRRGDIRAYLQTETPFPEREDLEEHYQLDAAYKRLFDKVLAFARESVQDESGGRHRQRVRYWSALALLRSLASSPAAAASTLRNRAATAGAEDITEVDLIGRQMVLDQGGGEDEATSDVAPGADFDEVSDGPVSRRLKALAREAEALSGAPDAKLTKAIELVRALVTDGYQPIVFCRFIPTADYVAEHFRRHLRGVEVMAVTGELPPDERGRRIEELGKSVPRVLVATDCLSEGINLQDHFDAVLHYDLSWNPTRHEQREGRVDRFGQPSSTVRVVTYYGLDNGIDQIVLRVLIRKHRAIRQSTGVSVPVPLEAEHVIEAVIEGVLSRQGMGVSIDQLSLFGADEPQQQRLFGEWEVAAEREKRSRTMFAQEAIHVEEVARELEAAREAIGDSADVATFVPLAVKLHGGLVQGSDPTLIDLRETPVALREAAGTTKLKARFAGRLEPAETLLTRSHPYVSGIAGYILDSALDPMLEGKARRCGVVRTTIVSRRTTLMLVRNRFHLVVRARDGERPLLCEDCATLAFEGPVNAALWLEPQEAEELLAAQPDANVAPEQVRHFLSQVVENLPALRGHLEDVARQRAEELLASHRRVRRQTRVGAVKVEPHLPPDILGVYVYLPSASR